MSKRSSRKAGRVVRRVLADGTVKTYRYAAYKPKARPGPAEDSLGHLIERWRRSPEWQRLADATRATYTIYLRALSKLEHTRAADMKRTMLFDLRDAINQSRGPGAAMGFVRAASSLFSWGVRRGLVEHSPATKLMDGLQRGSLPAWTAAQAEQAMRDLPEPLRRVVVLGVYTGQRRGDLIALPWSAYDGATIRLRQQKTGVSLVLPVHPVLKAELDAWKREATVILTDTEGLPWKPLRLSAQLPRAMERIGLPGLNVHGLRKLAATRLAEAGCTVHEIASITGHRSLSMVQLYTRSADQERLASAAIVRLTTGDKRNKN